MENPFESGHIKNYILFYVSIVVIMVLFFIASTLFLEEKSVDKKEFKEGLTQTVQEIKAKHSSSTVEQNATHKFKLLEKAY